MPAEVHHFTYGAITPVLSFAFSVVGSLLALSCTTRARSLHEPARRARWLLLASWALGGTGIWVMHFTAMIGFSVPNSLVRYDIPLTVASWAVAITVVGVGLFIAGMGHPSALKTLLGGLLTGVGVAAMHYTGMTAMRLNGSVGYDRELVAASVVIAVVAATVALWFTVTLHRPVAIFMAALIMGVAVNGMHFTGMAALRVELHTHPVGKEVEGASPLMFLGPMMLFVAVVVIVLVSAQLRAADVEARWALPGAGGPGLVRPGPPANAGVRPPEPAGIGGRGDTGVRGPRGTGRPASGTLGAGPARVRGAGKGSPATTTGGDLASAKGRRGRIPDGSGAGSRGGAYHGGAGDGGFFDPWGTAGASPVGGGPKPGGAARTNGFGPPAARDRRWDDPPPRGRR